MPNHELECCLELKTKEKTLITLCLDNKDTECEVTIKSLG